MMLLLGFSIFILAISFGMLVIAKSCIKDARYMLEEALKTYDRVQELLQQGGDA